MKRSILFLQIFFISSFSSLFLLAQTAGEVETVLSTPAINFAQASRFVLTVADVIDETAEAGAAYAMAREQGWLPKNVSSDNSVSLGELCFLIMKAFNIKGSFLNGVFPGPHYAFRELNYLKLIPGQRDPDLRVSGERFLQILGMVAAYTGIDRETPAPEEPAGAEAPEETPAPEEPAAVEAPVLKITVAMETPEEAPAAPEEPAAAEVPKEAPAVEKFSAIRLNNVQFMPNSAELMETEKAKLRDMAAVLSEYPDGKVLVGGYTAMAGSEYGRRRISTQRAQAVADFLISLEARPAEDIIVHGYGARRLLTNTAKGNTAVNRRVEITLLNEDYYRIQFMPDSTELKNAEKAKLRELAAVLSRHPNVELLVAGYTTTEGAEPNRVRISTARARAVADFLRLSGFRSGTITVRGYGAARPLGDNATPEGKAINRRVEIIIQNGSTK